MAKKKNPVTSVNKEIFAHAVEKMSPSAMPQAMIFLSEAILLASEGIKGKDNLTFKAVLRSTDIAFALFDKETGEPASKNFLVIKGQRVYYFDPDNVHADNTQFSAYAFSETSIGIFRMCVKRAMKRALM